MTDDSKATSSVAADPYAGTGARTDEEFERFRGALRHAAVVAPDGLWWMTKQQRGPITSVSELADFANQVFDTAYMRPTGTRVEYTDENGKRRRKDIGEYPQIWIVGRETRETLGWENNCEQGDDESDEAFFARTREEFPKQIKATLDPFLGTKWELVTNNGYFIGLRKTRADGAWYRINIVIEAMAWLPIVAPGRKEFGIVGVEGKAGSELPDDDGVEARKELMRRLAWSVAHLGTLPSQSPSATGATIQDLEAARKTKRDDLIERPTMLPSLEGMPGEDAEIEPASVWTLNYVPDWLLGNGKGRDIDGFVRIDQAASYLGSAGMVNVGYGRQFYLQGDEAVAFVIEREQPKTDRGKPKIKAPAGLYRITIPAGRELVATKGIPDAAYRGDEDAGTGYLPWPHPAMRDDEAVTTWVTGPTLDILREPVEAGGAGLTLDELNLQVAHVWEHETPMLFGWQARLRKARADALLTGNTVMYDFVKSIYTGYIGRMKLKKHWKFAPSEHHHQPILRASIMAHARNRGRRWAAKVAQEYGRWPLYTDTDSWVYGFCDGEILWGETWDTRDQHPEPLLASVRCGGFVVERIARLEDLPNQQLTNLFIASHPGEVKDALSVILPTKKNKAAPGPDGDNGRDGTEDRDDQDGDPQ